MHRNSWGKMPPIEAVKPVLGWKESSSSSSKGNYELLKERMCLFNKVMLTQQNEEDRFIGTCLDLERQLSAKEGRSLS